MPKVSIIVPVYGVEKYLEKCVESLVSQTLQDIEIILVDDGSKDRCPEICDELASKDRRIVVLHKPNGGLSDARNKGVEIATANYIIFVDSDDYVEKNMCEVLYSEMIKYDVDMVSSLAYEIKEGTIINQIETFESKVLSNKEALYYLMSGQGITMYAVGKIYKKSLFSDVSYPMNKLYEDAYTTPYVIEKANKILMTSHHLYYYVRRDDSITLAKYSIRDLDCIKAHQRNREYFKNQSNLLDEALDFRYYWSLMYIYDKILINNASNNEEAKSIWKDIKKNAVSILKNKYVSNKRKVALMMMLVSRKLYLKVLQKTGG